MNDPGKEAGSWLELALTAPSTLFTCNDERCVYLTTIKDQLTSHASAPAKFRYIYTTMKIWSLNSEKILKIGRRQGCAFFNWTKLQLYAVGPYIPTISTSQAHSSWKSSQILQRRGGQLGNCSMYPEKSWNCHWLSVRLSLAGDCATPKIVKDNSWSNALTTEESSPSKWTKDFNNIASPTSYAHRWICIILGHESQLEFLITGQNIFMPVLKSS